MPNLPDHESVSTAAIFNRDCLAPLAVVVARAFASKVAPCADAKPRSGPRRSETSAGRAAATGSGAASFSCVTLCALVGPSLSLVTLTRGNSAGTKSPAGSSQEEELLGARADILRVLSREAFRKGESMKLSSARMACDDDGAIRRRTEIA